MRISPLNLLFALYLGYMAFTLLSLQEEKHMRLYEVALQIKLWHALVAFGIVLVDIILRAFLSDTKKLWLVESLFIILIGGILQVINIIIPTSLF